MFRLEFLRVVLDSRRLAIEPGRAGSSRLGDEWPSQPGVELCRRRAGQLDDIDFAFGRVTGAGELETDTRAGIPNHGRFVRRRRDTGGQHERHPLAGPAEAGRTCP